MGRSNVEAAGVFKMLMARRSQDAADMVSLVNHMPSLPHH